MDERVKRERTEMIYTPLAFTQVPIRFSGDRHRFDGKISSKVFFTQACDPGLLALAKPAKTSEAKSCSFQRHPAANAKVLDLCLSGGGRCERTCFQARPQIVPRTSVLRFQHMKEKHQSRQNVLKAKLIKEIKSLFSATHTLVRVRTHTRAHRQSLIFTHSGIFYSKYIFINTTLVNL